MFQTPPPSAEVVHTFQLIGAGAFGAVIGWYVYYINRWRKDDVQLSDIVTLIGAIGGAAILTLFPAKSQFFGAYGIGLAAGFFFYFFVLVVLVTKSPGFTVDWFLDGRVPKLEDNQQPGTNRPMEIRGRE